MYMNPISVYALTAGVLALSAVMACYYRRSAAKFVLLMAGGVVMLVALAAAGYYQYFMTAFALGSAAGWTITSIGATPKKRRINAIIERRRDVVQVVMGIFVMALFAVVGLGAARYALLLIVMALYAFNAILNRYRRSGTARLLLKLEKPDAVYGEGAAMLGFGVLLAGSAIGSIAYIEFAMVALFFGDAIATIVGTHIGNRKMPHNRNKSVAGTAAFFIVVGALGFLFIGWYAVPFALVLALLESVDARVDDNVLIAVGAIALYALRAAV